MINLEAQIKLLLLTAAQLNIWCQQQIDPKATGYNVVHSIRFISDLNLEKLAFAQQAVIDRFDNLPCRFVTINEEPLQIIDKNVTVPTKTWDLQLVIHRKPETRWAHIGPLLIYISRNFLLRSTRTDRFPTCRNFFFCRPN